MTVPEIAFLVGAVGVVVGYLVGCGLASRPAPPPPPPRRDYDLEELTAAVQRGVSLLDALANRCSKCGKSIKAQMCFTTGRAVDVMAFAKATTCQCNTEAPA